MPYPRAAALVLAVAAAGPLQAQEVAQRGGEPAVSRTVVEDDGVRIEELRVRGQTRRIVVHSKLGTTRPYEIVPDGNGRDPTQDKRSSGQRVWSILSF